MMVSRSTLTSSGAWAESKIAPGCFSFTAARPVASTRSILFSTSRNGTTSAPISRHAAAHLELRLIGRVRRVNHEQQQRGFQCLCQGGAERGDQVVRKLLDEADRVGDEHTRPGLRL